MTDGYAKDRRYQHLAVQSSEKSRSARPGRRAIVIRDWKLRGGDSGASIEDVHPDVRLDVWLDVSCLFRTRSEAQTACKGGKIRINGVPAKPNRIVRVGDSLEIGRPYGRRQRVIVRGIEDVHVAKADARRLYEDVTPPPTPEEIELRRTERLFHAATTPPRAPDKRQRRELRRLKGRI
jgi:ribosome-associated heat shock protein Hsp15